MPFVFIGGLFLGVFIFGIGYDLWDGMYLAKFLGPQSKQITWTFDGVFAFILIIVALAMFWVAEWAEKKFPREKY